MKVSYIQKFTSNLTMNMDTLFWALFTLSFLFVHLEVFFAIAFHHVDQASIKLKTLCYNLLNAEYP